MNVTMNIFAGYFMMSYALFIFLVCISLIIVLFSFHSIFGVLFLVVAIWQHSWLSA